MAQPVRIEKAVAAAGAKDLAAARAWLDAVLDTAKPSYRDGLLIQLAYALCADGPIDLTKRPPGARTTAKELGDLLADAHVRAVADAYQNIAKNSLQLDRGNVPAFDDFLRWASESGRDRADLATLFRYVAARVAATARPVLPMPRLDLASLTFANVSGVLATLFDTPSEGAHEQFAIAALLHALVEQSGQPGYRVETKRLNASDASSKAAGDIQVMSGSRTIEAYEVTANEWPTKVGKAGKVIRDHDLSRLHIVAKVTGEGHDQMLATIGQLRDDVSVIEIRGFAASITSALTRQFRGAALVRLYELLDRNQSVVERVNAYVRLLMDRRLVAADGHG